MKLKNETLRAFYARTMNTQDRKVLHYRDQWRERELSKLVTKSVITISDVRSAAVRRYARKGGAR